jgi:hypothetical protein
VSGLALSFDKEGIRLLLDKSVSGLPAQVQAALLNVACARGSDPVYADRGTELMERAARDGVWSPARAQHLVNFAAVDTLFFLREVEPRTLPSSLQDVGLTPGFLGVKTLELDLYCESLDGQSLGLSPTFLTGDAND